MSFAHLHVHTEYSLLDGSNKIKEYVSRVKELGMNSAAITDHGVMFGCIDFYKAAKEAGIKPIMGCEVYVAPGSRFDREASKGEERYYHLVLLAENDTGYSNLTKIVSKGYIDGFYYKPRVDLEVLEQYHEGIIALSACLAGEIPRYLMRNFYEEAKKAALRYRDIFGEGNFFLEMQDHGIQEQQLVNQQLMRMSQETGIELVVTNDVHYTYDTDVDSHDILLCIQTGKLVKDENRMRYEGGQYYVKSEEEMRSLFPYALQAVENTQKIADRCNVTIEFGVTKLPRFDVPKGYDAWTYLNKLCFEGLERLYQPVTQELRERLQYELETIRTMGYVDYFLIVWDFIKFARDHGIPVGPGRGSAAGSLVSYTLGITQLDPMKYQLLFERFLNPARVTMPDIDVDFCFERRQEVIDYVTQKYGKDRVVQIVTFGTLAARGVIRDVGRVLDMPYARVDVIARMVPTELNITIDLALKKNHEFKELYDTDEEVRYLIDMSRRLEGLPRHTSMHAAGVVISQKPVEEYVPLSRASDGTLVTQFTMVTLEELGLLKMDFLGLRTLTVIQNAVELAQKSSRKTIDMAQIDYNDEKVLDMIGAGKTEGVFQLESGGMKKFMTELKPKSLEDIIAGISLYRPGPMDFIPQYIRGKNHPESVTYDTPLLKPILEGTYGCIVYQEQVMQIVQALAGYSLGRADLLRRAMSKKKASVMAKERESFVYGNEEDGVPGCIRNGISEQVANKIYDEMIDFAKYAFNKSHAAAYAVVSYQTAWLKYYYPVEFMAALMTSCIDNPNKVAEYIVNSRRMGIAILPPDVNRSDGIFTVEGNGIRYGMSAIKGVGHPVMEAVKRERKENGPFVSLQDFAKRMSVPEVNKKTVENFIKSGAFDSLGATRKQMLLAYVPILESVSRERKNAMTGQMSLFDFVDENARKSYEVPLPKVGEMPKAEKLAMEKEVLGIYVSGHPLEDYEACWRKNITAVTSDFLADEETGLARVSDGEKVIVGGIIMDKKVKFTKNNRTMAFLTLEDLLGTVEVIVFPAVYEKNAAQISDDARIFVVGRVAAEDERASKVFCEKIIPFDEVPKELWIQFADRREYEEKVGELYRILNDSDGKDQVVLYIRAEKAMKRLPAGRSICANEALLEMLHEKFGADNVKVVEKSIENRR